MDAAQKSVISDAAAGHIPKELETPTLRCSGGRVIENPRNVYYIEKTLCGA